MNSDKGKAWLIKELARKADFTEGDIRIILDSFIDIIDNLIFDSVESLRNSDDKVFEVLNLFGSFNISVCKIKAHTGFDAVRRKHRYLEDSYKIFFKPSRKYALMIKRKYSKDSLQTEE